MKSKEGLYILGGGTYGQVMYELSVDNDFRVEGFYDDNPELKSVMGIPVLGSAEDLMQQDLTGKNYVVAIGNNKIRAKFMDEIKKRGGKLVTLVHSSAIISPSAVLGEGVYVQPGVVVWTKVSVGDYTIISPNVVLSHHCKVGKGCLISILSIVGAYVEVGDLTMFGMNSQVIPGALKVGSNVMLGAGTVVTKDTGDDVVLVGSPARFLRKNI